MSLQSNAPPFLVQPQRETRQKLSSVAIQALLLREEAYTPLIGVAHPGRQGFKIVAAIMLVAALATSLGLLVDYATLPRIDLIQTRLFELIASSNAYQQRAAGGEFFSTFFNALYRLGWYMVRSTYGYPSRWDVVSSFFSILLLGILNWYAFGFLGGIVARWLGGKAPKGEFYAPLALAFAPFLLMVGNLLPGLVINPALIGTWWTLTAYQAIRVTYKLSWGRSVLVIILVDVLGILLLFSAVILGVLIGVAVYTLLY